MTTRIWLFDFVQVDRPGGPGGSLGIRVKYPESAFNEVYEFLTKTLLGIRRDEENRTGFASQ